MEEASCGRFGVRFQMFYKNRFELAYPREDEVEPVLLFLGTHGLGLLDEPKKAGMLPEDVGGTFEIFVEKFGLHWMEKRNEKKRFRTTETAT